MALGLWRCIEYYYITGYDKLWGRGWSGGNNILREEGRYSRSPCMIVYLHSHAQKLVSIAIYGYNNFLHTLQAQPYKYRVH